MRLFAAAAAVLLSACAAFSGGGMNVRVQPSSYSPAMSSTVGIGLTPVFVPPAGTAVRYRWRTNFGWFVAWSAPDYKVRDLSAEAESGEGVLYWTYDPKFAAVKKPAVTISVEALDGSGAVLARKTLALDWNRDVARVRD